jgi:hypothetical protein
MILQTFSTPKAIAMMNKNFKSGQNSAFAPGFGVKIGHFFIFFKPQNT